MEAWRIEPPKGLEFSGRLRRSGSSFGLLSEDALISCYRTAIKLQLEPDFIKLIEQELEVRDIKL